MYEPDDEELAAEEQAVSLRVSAPIAFNPRQSQSWLCEGVTPPNWLGRGVSSSTVPRVSRRFLN